MVASLPSEQARKKGARLILLVCHLSQKSAVSMAQLQAWIHLQLEIGRFSAILFNCTDSLKNLIFDEASLMLATEHDDLHAIHSACNSLLTILLVVCAPLDSLHTGMFKIVIIINLFILISIQKKLIYIHTNNYLIVKSGRDFQRACVHSVGSLMASKMIN